MLKKKLHDYIELFWEFFKLGMLTVGGGIAMIPLIQRVAVERKKWLSEEDMIDCIAVCQSLPGVIAINVATYINFCIFFILGMFLQKIIKRIATNY